MAPIALGLSWLAGVVFGQVWRIEPLFPLAIIWLALLSALVLWRVRRPFFVPLLLVVFLFGTVRANAAWDALESLDLLTCNDRPDLVTLRGTIDDEPDINGTSVIFTLGRVEMLRDGSFVSVSGRVRVSARVLDSEALRVGDLLSVTGHLQSAPVFDAFPYREFLLRHGISSVMDDPSIRFIDHSQLNWFDSSLASVREVVDDVLSRSMPLPQGAIAQGALLGTTKHISAELQDEFNRTGTSHILAVSGFNIAILASLITVLLRRVRRRGLASIITVVLIVAYVVVVGGEPSAVRAALMGSLVVIGDYFGRPAHTIASLIVAASVMTIVDPVLVGDIGFQLSFLATGGLVVLAPSIGHAFSRLPKALGEGIALTLAAQLATLPIIVVNFQQVSVLALPANLLVLPVLPAITVLSILTALAGIIHPLLGIIVGYLPTLFVSYLLLVVETLGKVPWSTLPTGTVSEAVALLYYFCLAIVVAGVWAKRRQITLPSIRVPMGKAQPGLVIAAGVVLVVVWTGALTAPTDDLAVSFLNVGQGDATLIKTPGHTILVDGGPDGDLLRDALDRRLPFWDNSLDLVVLTHSDSDHVGGLPKLFDRYHIGQVLQPKEQISTGVYGTWLTLLEENAVRVTTAEAGQIVWLDDKVSLTVLNPPHDKMGQQNDDNDISTVVRVNCGSVTILLTGDAGPHAQESMLDTGEDLSSTVLKVPHHGADGALESRFFEAVHPQLSIVSVGRNNRYGHPAPGTLSMLDGGKVYRTDVNGTIVLTVQGECLRVNTNSY